MNLSGFVYPAKHAYVVQENQNYHASDIDTCVLIILLLLAVAFYGSINYILGDPCSNLLRPREAVCSLSHDTITMRPSKITYGEADGNINGQRNTKHKYCFSEGLGNKGFAIY